MTLSFLRYFNLKERRHYNNPPNVCNPLPSLLSDAAAVTPEMLYLVVTDGFNFIFTGISAESCGNVVTPYSLMYLTTGSRNIPIKQFSIREKLAFFSNIFPKGLQTLRFLPSVFYKSVGRRQK